MENDEMAKRLVYARKLANHASASEAARAMGMPEQTYLAHENGSRGFARQAARYASFFKVRLAWLMTGQGSATGQTADDLIASLPPADQHQAFEYIEFLRQKRR